MSDLAQRHAMAMKIVDFEARRDKNGHIQIYELPKADGGGKFEVAGINERFHPEEAAHLADLVNEGKFDDAEDQAAEFIAQFTDHVQNWTQIVAVESYLRDCSFNRGPRGSARILQRAVGVDDDGSVGKITRDAVRAAEANPSQLLARLRAAREQYERDVAHRDESSIFWKGLVNRWNNALEFAKTFLTAPLAAPAVAAAPAAAPPGALPPAAPPPAPPPAAAAPPPASNFYIDVISKDPRFDSTGRISDMELLEPRTRELVRLVLQDAKDLGIELMVFETFRSKARQKMLFKQGVTKLLKVGVHHYGLACDLVKNVNGEPSWKGDFDFLGTIARHHGLVWGGDWGEPSMSHSFVDSDHVQRITKGRQASLFAGTWYPDASYDPYKDGAK